MSAENPVSIYDLGALARMAAEERAQKEQAKKERDAEIARKIESLRQSGELNPYDPSQTSMIFGEEYLRDFYRY